MSREPTDSPERGPLDLRFRRKADAVCEAVADGAVVLDLRTGVYYELNPIGLRIWERCTGERSARAIAAELAAAFGIPPAAAEADVARFLAELLEAGLVERAEGGP